MNTNGQSEGTQNGGTCTGEIRCDTQAYIDEVNKNGLCGYKDWRLPTPTELYGLLDLGASPFRNWGHEGVTPIIVKPDQSFFDDMPDGLDVTTGTGSYGYWSSITTPFDSRSGSYYGGSCPDGTFRDSPGSSPTGWYYCYSIFSESVYFVDIGGQFGSAKKMESRWVRLVRSKVTGTNLTILNH